MVEYALRRALYGVLVIFMVTVFVFLALRAVPGDAVRIQLADAPGVTEEQIAERTAALGLDQPVLTQLFHFLGGAITGDFGASFSDGSSVGGLIADRLPVTGQLGLMALAIGVVLGVVIGMASAVRPNGLLDQSLRLVSVSGLSVPSFWLGLLLVTYLAVYAGWSPPLIYQGPAENLGGNLAQMTLPALALGAAAMASIARMLRSSLLEVLQSDHLRTVRARGAGRGTTLFKHATRNSLLPVFTVLGLQAGGILGGTVILESIFGIPGMGSLTFEAVQMRDYPVVLGCVIVYGAVFVVVNIVVDLMYGVIDPRVRYR
ncbi:ABC transporter permease [Mangrovihabitans endophyticus]|uniref:ABC di/oligopeptide transporter inner membrane subunit n=1 Tax=Mangrovihabitans endophyticus TaxID=1751298 RepID=A0A8J3BSX2_9ACTN|nr:ABC transporter permease [Mangrovihabitans endophyticus]GGK74755.1 ABC di/oligopeptide transporter inner membrane subunit [Mangrovihabitans endophyticus]